MFRSPAFAGADVAKGRTIRRRRLEVAFFPRLRFSLRILPIFAVAAVTRGWSATSTRRFRHAATPAMRVSA